MTQIKLTSVYIVSFYFIVYPTLQTPTLHLSDKSAKIIGKNVNVYA